MLPNSYYCVSLAEEDISFKRILKEKISMPVFPIIFKYIFNTVILKKYINKQSFLVVIIQDFMLWKNYYMFGKKIYNISFWFRRTAPSTNRAAGFSAG